MPKTWTDQQLDGRLWSSRRAFSLVELLVVIAIIGVLVGLVLPALSSAREASRRTTCLNQLRQLALAIQNYESAQAELPAGAVARPHPTAPATPHTFYRWSVFAQTLPYMELGSVSARLDLSLPLYDRNFAVPDAHRETVGLMLPLLLCPSDRAERVHTSFGPTNYAASSGSGAEGGTPLRSDGMFFINSYLKLADVVDGTSRTVMIAETLLGEPVVPLTPRAELDHEVTYVFATAAPLTQASCDGSGLFNFTDPPSFAWANGEYRSAMYNHYRPPNSAELDCVSARLLAPISERYAAYGWRSSRSRHPGGVNVALADGSSMYVTNDVDPELWKAMATRAGGEAF